MVRHTMDAGLLDRFLQRLAFFPGLISRQLSIMTKICGSSSWTEGIKISYTPAVAEYYLYDAPVRLTEAIFLAYIYHFLLEVSKGEEPRQVSLTSLEYSGRVLQSLAVQRLYLVLPFRHQLRNAHV